jgi:MoaA/NifB/PqqE/SkfB family radical SAM enzyme
VAVMTAIQPVSLLELEITTKCQLTCLHCYSKSGPKGSAGTMTVRDWMKVIEQAAKLGVRTVQFIGGEPTFHPSFTQLLGEAIRLDREVEVFSNMLHVRPEWWALYSHPKVTLATSFYSDNDTEQDAITGGRRSHARTRANIAEAVRRNIPIRAGIINVLDGQRIAQARAELEALGVSNIGIDRLRGVGRGARTRPDMSQLCGRCGRGKAAISTDGDVWPCVLSRWLPRVGNVKELPLAEILSGLAMRELVSTIPGPRASACRPDGENDECNPDSDGGDCAPAEREACGPAYETT